MFKFSWAPLFFFRLTGFVYRASRASIASITSRASRISKVSKATRTSRISRVSRAYCILIHLRVSRAFQEFVKHLNRNKRKEIEFFQILNNGIWLFQKKVHFSNPPILNIFSPKFQ